MCPNTADDGAAAGSQHGQGDGQIVLGHKGHEAPLIGQVQGIEAQELAGSRHRLQDGNGCFLQRQRQSARLG